MDDDGDTKLLFELGIAPYMIEVAMGIENRYRIGNVLEHPRGCSYARVNYEIFAVYCYNIAVCLVFAHRLGFDVHNHSFKRVSMEYFAWLEQILRIANPHQKIEEFNKFYAKYPDMVWEHTQISKVWETPSFASVCEVVHPKDVPRRGKLHTKEGRAILLHAIAHIEYSAIDLALDAAYRYKNMPRRFYDDWLEVAAEECRHFLMIEELLHELGYRYGDFPVHQGLFDAARRAMTLIDRMAVVPRYLEANGLDANPKIIAKLSSFSDSFAKRMQEALQLILQEEIAHVQKGDRWFRWACEQEGVEDIIAEYMQRVERIYPGTLHSKDFLNIEARREAGFSCDEMRLLAKGDIVCG